MKHDGYLVRPIENDGGWAGYFRRVRARTDEVMERLVDTGFLTDDEKVWIPYQTLCDLIEYLEDVERRAD